MVVVGIGVGSIGGVWALVLTVVLLLLEVVLVVLVVVVLVMLCRWSCDCTPPGVEGSNNRGISRPYTR